MLTALTDLLTELLNSILIYRVKDVHDTIRALCITRLGQSPTHTYTLVPDNPSPNVDLNFNVFRSVPGPPRS